MIASNPISGQRNSYGKTWVYARVKGSSLQGWMSKDNLAQWINDGQPHCADENHRD
ncbi:hypothetical protein [Nonomuraea africana]|uniref:SH3 domain-containing protein n=1 Tax=Nonomuraea africana TaxID=46171 RepID=A0ABR9KRN2_9ACTN|nr:hypothetical protein [Nonomuraea africana]MBE1564401.1 hypothetical protein [Nonomuraea africana]